jgi:hypothetical protein
MTKSAASMINQTGSPPVISSTTADQRESDVAPVDLIHTDIDSPGDEQGNCILHQTCLLMKQMLFICRHFSQYIPIHRLPLSGFIDKRTSNAYFHAGKNLGTKVTDDGPYAIVPCSPTLTYHFYSSRVQINIIMHDQDMFQGNFEIVDKSAHTAPGKVHIGLRLEQKHLSAMDTATTEQSLHFIGIYPPSLNLGKMINEIESDIVTGTMILQTWITQACYKKNIGARHAGSGSKKKEPKIFGSKRCHAATAENVAAGSTTRQ